jgi:hypothetical protein
MSVAETWDFINSNAEPLVMMLGSLGFLGYFLYSLYFEVFGNEKQKESKKIRFYNGDSHPFDEKYNSLIEIKNSKIRYIFMYPLFIIGFSGMLAMSIASIDF